MYSLIFLLSQIVSMPVAASFCDKHEKTISHSLGDEFQVNIVEYAPQGRISDKVVIIVPPTGGMNFIDKSYAKRFCGEGITAVVVKNWTGDDEYNLELSIHTRFYNRAQKALDLVVDEYSQKELGILGTSVGGIHASISFARRPEVTRGFLIVSGGGIADIIAHTTQEVLYDAKIQRKKIYKFKDETEYSKALQKILPFEPLNMEFDRSNKQLGMVISKDDKVVPTDNQMQLFDKWQPEMTLWSNCGHKATVIKTWLLSTSTIINFFK